MTDGEIIDVARSYYTMGNSTSQDIIAFARAIAAAEREACARVCEDGAKEYDNEWNNGLGAAKYLIEACEDCAAAIRARSET